MDDATLKALFTQGVGGIIAAVVLYFYREDRKASETKFTGVAADFRAIVENNTTALTAVKTLIEDRFTPLHNK